MEEQGKIDATVREPPKKAKEPKQKIKLTHQLWAKILAFVLLGLFIAIIIVSFLAALISNVTSHYSLQEFIKENHEYYYASERAFGESVAALAYNLARIWLPLAITGIAGAVVCLIFLFISAGKGKKSPKPELNLIDKLPLDIYAAVCFVAAFSGAYLIVYLLEILPVDGITRSSVNILLFLYLAAYVLFLIALAPFLSFATRIKVGGGIWWRNTVIYRVLRLCWRVVKWCWSLVKRFCGWVWYMTKKIPIVPRTAIIMAAILFFNFLLMVWNMNVYGDAFVWFLLFIMSLVIFVAACFGAWQMKTLKAAGERMAKGDIDEKIDTQHMYWEFKHHAENLNSIGDGMAAAVEQRMKSERLKTELITNVSHDIKTPLTSIVNYVDLLQKPHTPEQEAEYLEVLDRQSKRLKKLTEDLVEASKASTGNMNVNIVRTNTREIIEQSLAEYGRRMEQGNLAVIVSIPDEPPHAMADGRLLWRVLDNLFNNVVKYALPGTRVYITSELDGGEAVISVKNISRDPLNISAEELMERFVRGDSSRHTEGSGLGLNIAQSLVNLMRGKFSISVDGDLFKAEIRLPKA